MDNQAEFPLPVGDNEVPAGIVRLEQKLNLVEPYIEIPCGKKMSFSCKPVEVALAEIIDGREAIPPTIPTNQSFGYRRVACWEVGQGDSLMPIAYTAQGKKVEFTRSGIHRVLKIGNNSENEWRVDGLGISRRHATVHWGKSVGFWVETDSFTNPTYARSLDYDDADEWLRYSSPKKGKVKSGGTKQERTGEVLFKDKYGGSCSDKGEREENQDRTGSPEKFNISQGKVDQLGELRVVADGVGGHANGALAAETAVCSFFKSFYSGKDLVATLDTADADVSRATSEGASTVVAAVIQRDDRGKAGRVEIVQAGDSRAYILGLGETLQVTHDHSEVQAKVDAGELTQEQAVNYPNKHIITSALGGGNIKVNRYEMRWNGNTWDIEGLEVGGNIIDPTIRDIGDHSSKGEFLLMCSDGFSGLLDDGLFTNEEIWEIVSKKNFSMSDKAKQLVVLAKDRAIKKEYKKFDNITVDLAEL